LLAQSVAAEFGGRVRFVSENYGDSELARQFGVTRYPAIFVDDVLAATPSDFGFYGKGETAGDGRYAPWQTAAAHERFRSDLIRMIDLVLAGRKEAARAVAPRSEEKRSAALSSLALKDLDGKPLSASDLSRRAVLVEMWATWCPPCRGTLGWLGSLKKRYGDRLAVVALAVQSNESEVRRVARELDLPLVWGIATPEVARSVGDVAAVPTLFLFDRDGNPARAFYGATPTLHAEAESAVSALVAPAS
jgi:thiol-disulfide isomerase/thioredoxin